MAFLKYKILQQPVSQLLKHFRNFHKESFVKYDQISKLALISLNRPESRNAINRQLLTQLCEKIDFFNQDQKCDVAVIYGTGGNFCVGLDWNDFQKVDDLNILHQLFDLLPTSKPIVAALEGFSTCLGFQIACLCDARVAEIDTQIGFHEASVPILPKVSKSLSSLCLDSPSLDHLISAQTAFEKCFINELVPVGCAFGRSLEWAKCLLKFPQKALLLDREVLWKAVLHDLNDSDLINDQLISQYQRVSDILSSEAASHVDRFIYHSIGRHGSMQLHSLEEIKLMHWQEIFNEQQLKSD